MSRSGVRFPEAAPPVTWADLQPGSAQVPSRVAVRVAIAAGHSLSGQTAAPIRAASRAMALLTWVYFWVTRVPV